EVLAEPPTAYSGLRRLRKSLIAPGRGLFLGDIELIDIEDAGLSDALLELIEPDIRHDFHQPSSATLLAGQLVHGTEGAPEGFLYRMVGRAMVIHETQCGVMQDIQVG